MLYVGTNYHPHDWDETRWEADIKLMKEASFNMVRLGHLCWDSFEPSDGEFRFEWFSKVMDKFYEAGIQVVLDIATRPAPVWLHKKHPSINITDIYGKMQYPHTRYMEDVGNPFFQLHAYRFARAIVRRYAYHPALLSFGMCNELGAGFVSNSEEVKKRFIKWLRHKYGGIEELNDAWSTQRWSRRLGSFEDVDLPASAVVNPPPERYLDLCRFYSDEIIEYMSGLKQIIEQYAPNARESTNHWAEHKGIGFDYLKAYRKVIDIPGIGFYPGVNPEDTEALIGTCMILDHRIAESGSPAWCLEFQTGTFGGYASPKKAMRMYAYLSLLYRNQAVIAWTWRSMLGGEEQYWFGLLDHDGVPGRKYYEFRQIAEEFRKLGDIGLPREADPEVAIAYSFESLKVTQYNRSFYKTEYYEQLINVYKSLFYRNLDCNVVDLREMKRNYQVVFIPGHCVMDKRSAETVRKYVWHGGTAVMTAYSAKVDERNRVFDTAMPGLLSDVFGIRANAFERTRTHVADINEGGMEKHDTGHIREKPGISLNGSVYHPDIDYYEILELKTAETFARFTDIEEELPAISINRFGKGIAIYMAVPVEEEIILSILDWLHGNIGLKRGLETPRGVVARQLPNNRTIFVNTTGISHEVKHMGQAKSILSGQGFSEMIPLGPYEVEVLEPL